MEVSGTRGPLERSRTCSWCRRARISRCNAARERIEELSVRSKREENGHGSEGYSRAKRTSILTTRRGFLGSHSRSLEHVGRKLGRYRLAVTTFLMFFLSSL